MTLHCPDCLTEIAARKAGQDARCARCRTQYADRREARVRRRVATMTELADTIAWTQ